MQVKAWIEQVTIPTYGVGHADKNPMFFEKRVYQGSSGVVYPNPVIEKISDEKEDRQYTGVFIENDYLKIMILPELGGRVQMAYDKVRERHFIYYNQVIKPALVGLCGPWISGGIEFNWPQHHRPSTFDPVDFDIEHNADGSITVWVNELEKMFHTKGMAGFTLHPDKAVLEIKAKLTNPTPMPQTFLWWANPAVKVNDHYQSVFPPDVNAVFDHGKRDVSSFPIATGTYYKVDYSPGTDISMYKNIPVPTSYMAVNSSYDFVGGYEHDSQAGMLHIADHHVSPGKKQWTWGNGDFGVAWDRNLTDEDGPYIELMTGVFTDNQPDFTWLMPFEEKTFTQYFLPYRELGLISNASRDLLLSFNINDKKAEVKLFATTMLSIEVTVKHNKDVLLTQSVIMQASEVYSHSINLPQAVDQSLIEVYVTDQSGKEILYFRPETEEKDIPKAATAALFPEEIKTTEELFLTGQHLEQYRHATFSPVPYYERALNIDGTDIRNNNALGAWYLRRGRFDTAENYFRTAIKSITARNPNPYDSEPYFNLGLSLFCQGKMNPAYDAFFKATWNSAWQDAGYFYIAKIDMQRGHFEKALEHINWSIDRNARNGKACLIKMQALEALGRIEEAISIAEQALARDLFNLGVLFKLSTCYRLLGNEAAASQYHNTLLSRSRKTTHNLIECAIDFIETGAYADAYKILFLADDEALKDPLINYYLAYVNSLQSNADAANQYLLDARNASPDGCFPNRLQDIQVLQHAVAKYDRDSRAHYYLGNLYYDKRQYDLAIHHWERSHQLDENFATVNRNLGIAVFNKLSDVQGALSYYEKAFALDTTDARVMMELDQLYKRTNKSPGDRLAFLEKYDQTAMQRDDLYLEMVTLHNLLGNYQQAYNLLMSRKFHPWEGGEGKVSTQYILSLIELAKAAMVNDQNQYAVDLLKQSLSFPQNLGEGKLPGTRDNDIYFWLGCAYEGLGQNAEAQLAWKAGAVGDTEPSAAVFYNDSPPDKILYQGLCLLRTGMTQNAADVFNRLISYGYQHMKDHIRIDYFAVSLPDLMVFDSDLDEKNRIHCIYLMGLGHLGLNNVTEGLYYLQEVLSLEASHVGATTHQRLLLNSNLLELIFKPKYSQISL